MSELEVVGARFRGRGLSTVVSHVVVRDTKGSTMLRGSRIRGPVAAVSKQGKFHIRVLLTFFLAKESVHRCPTPSRSQTNRYTASVLHVHVPKYRILSFVVRMTKYQHRLSPASDMQLRQAHLSSPQSKR